MEGMKNIFRDLNKGIRLLFNSFVLRKNAITGQFSRSTLASSAKYLETLKPLVNSLPASF